MSRLFGRTGVVPSGVPPFVPTDISDCHLWLRADLGISWYYNTPCPWSRVDLYETFSGYLPEVIYDYSILTDTGDQTSHISVGDTIFFNLCPISGTGIVAGRTFFSAWGGDWTLIGISGTIPSGVPWAGADTPIFTLTPLSLPSPYQMGKWADQSGCGNHATQGIVANQFIYTADVKNGKPALYADGNNDMMWCNGLASVWPTQLLEDPFTMFCVFLEHNTAPYIYNVPWSISRNDAMRPILRFFNNYDQGEGFNTFQKYDGAHLIGDFGAYSTDVWRYWIIHSNATEATVVKNGLVVNDHKVISPTLGMGPGNCATIGDFYYGGGHSSYMQGYFAEFAFWNRIILDTEITQLKNYAVARYAIS